MSSRSAPPPSPDLNECSEKLACTCPGCHCKNTWGNYECTCKGNQLYIRGEDVCIGDATSFFSDQY